MTATDILKSLVNILFPPRCACCNKDLDASEGYDICRSCLESITPNPKPNCEKCGRPNAGPDSSCEECRKSDLRFSRAYSACIYEGSLKELIHAFKYGGRISLSRLLSNIMVDFMKNDADITAGIDLLTFVPQSPGRLHKKGFNQSEMLVSNLSGAFGIPVIDALEKSRITKNQNELSRQERLINLIGAFRVKNSRAPSIKDKRILLIDDVMTTGATLNECAKTLLGGGAKEARCMTLARGA